MSEYTAENDALRCAACGSKIRWSRGWGDYVNLSNKRECPAAASGHAPLAPDALGRNVEASESSTTPAKSGGAS